MNMRALKKKKRTKNKKKITEAGCVVCKDTCVDEVPKIICRINQGCNRVTRSLSRMINSMNEFIILEIYRCMPLLGNEDELMPKWNIHIVHYSIVFTNLGDRKYYLNDDSCE